MSRISRRSFLAASAAFVAAPAIAAPAGADVDVVIIGAGAAGIAAARRIVAARRTCALFEASPRIGGRCATDTKIFGVPFDLGAHWIHSPDTNPLVAAAPKTGIDIYAAPRAQTARVGPRPARDSEMENFLAAQVRARRAIADALRGKADTSASRALPKDLGDWQSAIEFMFGPYALSKDLANVSAMDLARAAERDSASFCRQGYGGLLAKLATDLPVRLSAPVSKVTWGGGLVVATPRGDVRARAAIVTVSTDMLTSDKIEFVPPLPKRQLDAAAKLSLGSLDHIALEIPGNPLLLQQDDLVFEQSNGARTAALLANVSGTSLHVVEVGGEFGRALSGKGEAAMVDFAGEWLASLFGSSVRSKIKRSHATRWSHEPYVLGAMSAAGPGNAEARKVLQEPVAGRVWFAGEALHDTQWGTVNGAWESGTRAADGVLRWIGAIKPERQEKQAKPAQRKRKRGGEE
jgi:monoamine oxidase